MHTDLLTQVLDRASELILGKRQTLQLALAGILAQGHLLIEDIPGVGKTTLAHVLARLLGLQYQRIQFTSDLLPADIIGSAIYDRDNQQFRFHKGPVFTQLLLADEINRATPKAQSALLEAMEEQQITAEGNSHALPQPFIVIATQNPAHQIGTFPLPESQLDRFLLRIHLGYPDRAAERELLNGVSRRDLLQQLEPVLDAERLLTLQQQVARQTAAPALIEYIQDICDYTRQCRDYRHGLSPRAALALLHCARAWSMLAGRSMVLPEDVQAVLGAVVAHRLAEDSAQAELLGASIIEAVAVP
ncbi:MAG: AAA family ATPase [gamma proteobacterium symbiont of Bathyaustriella thionipta]|nr:AAA family ATPase [gamma proteobacterium symbiont of Bathyaustriella thionipta]